MTDSQVKQIHIEGDKSFFVSKKAVDRFKKDLRNKDTEKLQENDYFVEDWTYELVSENETAAALVSCTIDLLEYSLALAIFVSSTFFLGSVFSYSCNCLINPILGQMIERRDLTKLRAFQNSKPFSFIR
jgi:hypothetical protein